MKTLKITTPLLKKISMECHAEALPAFFITKDFRYQYEQIYLSRDLVNNLQMLDPIHALQLSINKFEFFAGWHSLNICRQLDIKRISIIVYSEIQKDDIQTAAWTYLLGNQFKTFHRHKNLAQLMNCLESMPLHIRKKILGLYGTNSSQRLIEYLSYESRSAIRNQQKNFILPIALTSNKSIREKLTEGNKDVS